MVNLPGYSIRSKIHVGNDTLIYSGIRNSDGTQVVVKVSAALAGMIVDGLLSRWDCPIGGDGQHKKERGHHLGRAQFMFFQIQWESV